MVNRKVRALSVYLSEGENPVIERIEVNTMTEMEVPGMDQPFIDHGVHTLEVNELNDKERQLLGRIIGEVAYPVVNRMVPIRRV